MDEQAEWTKALEDAERSGRPFWYGPPFHCATGTKPA